MNRAEAVRAAGDPFRKDQLKPTVILLSSTLLMLGWWYVGSPDFYRRWLSPQAAPAIDPNAAAAVYSFGACFLLLGVVPALIVKLVFREGLAGYGVQWGDRGRTVRSFLLLAPGCVLAAYLASRDPATRDLYPLNKSAGNSPAMFALHACTYLVFYVGWEFHFRGFLQFGLRNKLGTFNALLVQVMASSLLHLGKSGLEAFAAILGGILWGAVAYRTRSLLSGLLQHFLLGIALDWFLCYL
jgi:membrane protease YdiL (CAAX protease family)